jgi:hypothetical protein
MTGFHVALYVFAGAAVLFALIVSIRDRGIAGAAKGVARQVGSIRAYDVMGTGVRLLGVAPGPHPGQSVATFWITAFYLPVVPLGRRVVVFVEPSFGDAAWHTVAATPLRARAIARTYLYGWIFFPVALIAPFISGSLIYTVTQLFPERELGDVIRTAGVLVAAVPTLVGVPWFAIGIVRLARWDQRRKRPPSSAAK